MKKQLRSTTIPSGFSILSIDEWVKFIGNGEAVTLLMFLKTHVQTLVLKRMRGQAFDQLDERAVNVLKKMLVERESESVVENPAATCFGPRGNNAVGRGASRGYSNRAQYRNGRY